LQGLHATILLYMKASGRLEQIVLGLVRIQPAQSLATLEDSGLLERRQGATWMSADLYCPVDAKPRLDYLHRLVFSRRWPAARSPGPQEEVAYKKLAATADVANAQALHRPVELWASDEHRLGPQPLIRRLWGRRRQHPRGRSRSGTNGSTFTASCLREAAIGARGIPR
jgi:hypothetical protein